MILLMGVGSLASFGLFAGLGAMFVLPKLMFSALSLVSGAVLLAAHRMCGCCCGLGCKQACASSAAWQECALLSQRLAVQGCPVA